MIKQGCVSLPFKWIEAGSNPNTYPVTVLYHLLASFGNGKHLNAQPLSTYAFLFPVFTPISIWKKKRKGDRLLWIRRMEMPFAFISAQHSCSFPIPLLSFRELPYCFGKFESQTLHFHNAAGTPSISTWIDKSIEQLYNYPPPLPVQSTFFLIELTWNLHIPGKLNCDKHKNF